jgi:dTDP-4-dehydrorhamnose reductase
VGVIGTEALKLNANVLHFSTDYVFPGNGVRGYREDDPTGPVNAYGRSKLAGEHALKKSGCRHILVRTSWVYGARGKNFLRTMLRFARTRDRLTVVNDQHGAPTTARLIASVVATMLARIASEPLHAKMLGTFHLGAAGHTTWHGFASEIVALAARAGLVPRAVPVEPMSTRDYITRAARPGYSVLDSSKIARVFGLGIPDWKEGLERCIAELADQEEERLGSVLGRDAT